MAKKNLGSFKGQDRTTSNLDFDFDNEASAFDRFDFNDGANTNTKNNRNPINEVRQGISSALGSAQATFLPSLGKRIAQSIPDAARFTGEVGDFASDLSYLSSQFQQDVAPMVQQLKRAGRSLGPRVKQFLPKSLQTKYDRLVSSSSEQSRSNAKLTKEDAERQAISASLDEVFKKQLQAQADAAVEQKTDSLIDRALTTKQHGQSYSQLQAIRAGTAFHQTFLQAIQIPYMKKDLEIKYKHYFVAKDTLSVVQGLSKIVEKKLDEIRHNTGLPDVQKLTRWEGVKEAGLQRFGNVITNWQVNMLRKLQSRVLDPFKEGLSMAGDAAETMGDTLSTMDEISGNTRGVGGQSGSILGMMLGNKLAKGTGKFLFGEQYGAKGLLSNKMASLNHLFKNAKTRLALKAQQMADDREGSFLGEMLSILAPDLQRGGGRTTNTMLKDPNAPGTITNAFTLSVTTIMPGYMAKMVKLLEEIKTGKPADELVFDRDSNDFITVSTLQKKFASEAFGSASSRRQNMARAIGTIRGTYKATSGSDLTDFDNVQDDLAQFITNCAMYKKQVEPAVIKEFAGIFKQIKTDRADSDEFVEDDYSTFEDDLASVEADERVLQYMRQTFKGVQHPEALLALLASLLFDSNGNLDRQAYSSIDDVLVEQMNKDEYLAVFDKYVSKYGNARHLKPFISSSGSQFTHNEAAIKQHLLTGVDMDDKDFLSDRDIHTNRETEFQTAIRQQASLSELLKDPSFNTGAVGKTMAFVRKHMGETGSQFSEAFNQFRGGLGDFWNNDVKANIPDDMKQWLAKRADRSHKTIQGMQDSFNEFGDAAAMQLKLRRLKETSPQLGSAESRRFDPFWQGQDQDQDFAENNGFYRGVPPYVMAAFMNGPSAATRFHLSTPSIQRKVVPVTLENAQAVADFLTEAIVKSHTVTPQAVTQQIQGDVVGAVNQFEGTFKEYAEKQSSVPELLNRLLDVTGALSGQMDSIIGNTTSTLRHAFRWTRDHANFKSLASLAKKSVTIPWGATKLAGRMAGVAVPGAWNWATKTALPYAQTRLKQGMGLLGAGARFAGGLSMDALGAGLTGLGLSSDILAGKLATGLQWMRDKKDGIKTTFKGGFTNFKNNMKQRWKDKVYIDVYVKDKVDPGNPILSKRQQEDGVVFVKSGKRLLTTYALNAPVMNPNTEDVLVTEQDIKDGLVDIHNRDILGARSAFGKALQGTLGMAGSLLKKGKAVGKTMLGLLTGQIPFADLLGKSALLGLDGMRALGRGAGKLFGRMFGLSEGLNKEDLKSIVGDKLDIIIEILKRRYPNGPESNQPSSSPKPGDLDGDGKSDSIFQARQQKEKEKEEKKKDEEQRGFYDTMRSIKDGIVGKKGEKKGLIDTLLGVFGAGGVFSSLYDVAKGIWSGVSFMGSGIFKLLSFVGTIGRLLGRGIPGLAKGAFSLGGGLFRQFMRMGRVGKLLTAGAGLLGMSHLFGGSEAVASETDMPEDHDLGEEGGGSGGSVLGGLAGEAAQYGMMAGGLSLAKKFGGKALAKLGIRAGGKMAARGAIAAAAGGSGPVGWIVGGGLLALDAIDTFAFGGKYSQNVYNWIGIGTDDFAEARCKLYGVNTDFKAKNLLGDGGLRQTIKLEDRIYDMITKNAPPLNDADYESWTDKFGLDSSDPSQVKYWVTWFRRRFLPICKSYLKALQDEKVSYADVGQASDGTKNKILQIMQGECGIVVQNTQGLEPTPEAFKKFKESEEKWKSDKSDSAAESKAAAASQDRDSKIKTEKESGGSGKYDLSASEAAAIGSTSGAGALGEAQAAKNKADYAAILSASGGNPDVARLLGGDAFNAGKGNAFRGGIIPGGAGTYAGGNNGQGGQAGSAGGATGSVDMSGVNPANLKGQDGELGSYVAQFESGSKGSAAISYDPPGGTSYGSYQLSSRMGSLREFVEWCKTEAPEVYKALMPLVGKANTGSSKGEFPNAWLQLVKEGKITHALEHKFYVAKFYNKAMGILQKQSPEVAQFVQGNRALQEAFWSCAIQHGPGGAVRLFTNYWKKDITPEAFARALYGERFTEKYFPRLAASAPDTLRSIAKNRGPKELSVILGLMKQGGGPADTAGGGAAGGASPAGAASPDSGAGGGEGSSEGGAPTVTTQPGSQGASSGADGGGGNTVSVAGNGSPAAVETPSPGGDSSGGATAPALASSHGAGSGAPSGAVPISTTTAAPAASGNSDLLGMLTKILEVIQAIANSGQSIPDLLQQLIGVNQQSVATMAAANQGNQSPTPFSANLTGTKVRRQSA